MADLSCQYKLIHPYILYNCVQLLEGAGMFHNCKKDYQKRGMYEGERQDKSPRRTDAGYRSHGQPEPGFKAGVAEKKGEIHPEYGV